MGSLLPQVALVPSGANELAASVLQGAITAGLAGLCAHLFVRYGRPWFGWFAIAWSVYFTRLLCILVFLVTSERIWLYWHQVTTGWTALVLLFASFMFLRQPKWQWWYLLLALFPPLWSYVAIYRLDNFLWAALPAVIFLSAATIWTGVVFWRHYRVAASGGAGLLALAFFLWGLHHLDYPFLRAQGAWNPWGYYLDICFELLVGAGLVVLVLDDLKRGVRALTDLSGDLHRRGEADDPLDKLVSRPLTLPGVSGSAIYLFEPVEERAEQERTIPTGSFTRGTGTCSSWTGEQPDAVLAQAMSRMKTTRRPQILANASGHPFVAALPIISGQRLVGALIMSGDVRNPFTALDDDFLFALGQQVGAALEQADLDRQLASRTQALERLSKQMVRQHEDERRRLSRELHDETAQVFTAVRMQLEGLRSVLPQQSQPRFERLLALTDTGIRSIRNVTTGLRPSLLDDLGLLPALRSLASDFAERSGLRVTLKGPQRLPVLRDDADLALFRALQEALSNVARHASATEVDVQLNVEDESLEMRVRDDGVGMQLNSEAERSGMGLTGMRERIQAVGGEVEVRAAREAPADDLNRRGTEVLIRVPVKRS